MFPTGRRGMTKITVGAWRDDRSEPMQVVSSPMGRERVHYEAPPTAQVAKEMKVFIEWCNEETTIDPVLKAAIAHLWFVTIRPFDDGNGRIARDCRHGTRPLRKYVSALLQHVGANSP